MGGFPEPGELFEGKYRIRDLLGSGGFARVYRAEQTDLGREVALKILSPQVSSLASNDSVDSQLESVAIRFEREAKVVSKLRSPYTITVYDYGRTGSGLLYMVLEYVDGLELDEVNTPMEPRRVARVLEQVLKSLQEAHAHDLLHRDLKPANIMLYEHLGDKDQVKLLDFGIAKMVGEAQKEKREEQDLTAADSLIGTPRYMSPEQIRGENVGPASDIYSLGLVIYELLVGEKAITSSDSIEILGKHLSAESFKLPESIDVHPDVRAIVNRMLEKEVTQRYAATDGVLEDVAALDDIRGDLSGEFANLPPVPDEDTSWADDERVLEGYNGDPAAERAEDDNRRKPFVWLGVAALVALVGGAIAFFAMQDDPASEDAEPTPVAVEKPSEPVEPEPEPEPTPEPTPKVDPTGQLTRIETSPAGAMVYVADRLVGEAPAEFGADDFEFPVQVRVELEEATVTQTLDEPGGTMTLEMEGALADARDAREAREQEEAEQREREREARAEARAERERQEREQAQAQAASGGSESSGSADSQKAEEESESDDSGGSGYIPLE